MFERKRILTYVKILIVGIFIVLVAIQADKSFVLDEIDFPTVSNATSQSGRPVYYHSEQSPEHVGTYHPTLYINALASFIRGFGFSGASIRFFGAICVLLSAYLLILIYRQLSKKNEKMEVLFLGLFLLNPYTIANATLPDIDPTVLPVLLLIFVYVSLKFLLVKRLMNRKVTITLGLLFALVLWSKLTTPLVIPPFLACLAIITTKDYKKSLLFALKVSLIGASVFVVTYFLYCMLLNLSPTYTYTFLVASFTKGTSTEGPLLGIIHNITNIRYFAYWITIPLLSVLLVSIIGTFLNKAKDEKVRIQKLLLALALAVTIFYIALIAPFGGFFKYPFPAFGLMLLSIPFFFEKYFETVRLKIAYVALFILLGFVVEKTFWKDSMFLSSAPFQYLWLVLLIAIVGYVVINRFKAKHITAVVCLSIILFSIGFQVSISRVQAIAPYPTKYLYGQLGIDDAAAYLRLNTKHDEVIWSMKDIGYYVNYRYVESYAYYFDKPLQNDLVKMLQDGKVRYYVATTGIGQDNLDYYSDVKQILDTYGVKEKQFGNYVIYRSKTADMDRGSE